MQITQSTYLHLFTFDWQLCANNASCGQPMQRQDKKIKNLFIFFPVLCPKDACKHAYQLPLPTERIKAKHKNCQLIPSELKFILL